MRVLEGIDLSIGGLCAGPGGKVFDREPVCGEKAEQLGIDSTNGGVGRIEIKNSRHKAVSSGTSPNEEDLEDFGDVVVTAAGTWRRECVIEGDKSFGLPDGARRCCMEWSVMGTGSGSGVRAISNSR